MCAESEGFTTFWIFFSVLYFNSDIPGWGLILGVINWTGLNRVLT